MVQNNKRCTLHVFKKSKEGVFVGSQIRAVRQDVKFEDQLSEVEKKQHGNHSKMSLPMFWVIIRHKAIVIRCLMLYLYNPTEVWAVICLYTCIS